MTDPKTVQTRSEFLFCYDITDANPNGDPLDDNKPRIDLTNNTALVTDVRIKRTVRDYLMIYKGHDGSNGKDIFVREIKDDGGKIQDGKTRVKSLLKEISNGKKTSKVLEQDHILDTCIDVRLFGGVLPQDGDAITFTGPIQLKMARSLHPVDMHFIKGTGAFASTEGNTQKTFREEHVLHYAFIGCHGIINPKAAEHTKMSDADVKEFFEGLWYGTPNLITRSKFGQQPRLLIKINYKDPRFFIGDLDKKIKLISEKEGLSFRSYEDFSVDISGLCDALQMYKDFIASIEYIKSPTLNIDIPPDWKVLTV